MGSKGSGRFKPPLPPPPPPILEQVSQGPVGKRKESVLILPCCFSVCFLKQDKQLTKEEILAKHDLFVGSRATNYGKDLEKHDEF